MKGSFLVNEHMVITHRISSTFDVTYRTHSTLGPHDKYHKLMSHHPPVPHRVLCPLKCHLYFIFPWLSDLLTRASSRHSVPVELFFFSPSLSPLYIFSQTNFSSSSIHFHLSPSLSHTYRVTLQPNAHPKSRRSYFCSPFLFHCAKSSEVASKKQSCNNYEINVERKNTIALLCTCLILYKLTCYLYTTVCCSVEFSRYVRCLFTISWN